MRIASVLAALSLAGCAGGASPDPGDLPDGGAASCQTGADCDDGDRCTSETCDRGACLTSPIDACAESTSIIEEDFESTPERPMRDAAFFDGDEEAGWRDGSAPGCPVGIATVLEDDFEGYGKPAAFVHGEGGWLFSTPGGGSVALVSSPGGAGYAMNVVGTTAGDSYGEAAHPLTPQASGWVELRLQAPGNFKSKVVQLDEDGATRFNLFFDSDGQIKYSNAGSKVALRGYSADVWYSIRIEWDADRQRAAVEIDGTRRDDLALHAAIADHIDGLRVRTAVASGLSFMVDDVSASGGDGVGDGAGSLRVGAPQASCQSTSRATLAFPPARGGVLEVDLMAEGDGDSYEIQLAEGAGGDGAAGERISLFLEPGGTFYWSQGAVKTSLPVDSRWSAGTWLHLSIRWEADLDAFEVAIGDDPPAVRLTPVAPIGAGIDRLRVIAPPAGALWIDELHIARTTR